MSESISQSSASSAPLISTISNDPDMAELISFFTDEMADRAETISNAARQNDIQQLRMLAHQLKGSATGYGFEPISKSAATLEQRIDTSLPDDITPIKQEIDELIDLCRRAAT